ncbi:MAG: nickel-dependent lactate racemase [Proteobacteria bacterium]|nr:nickel-dependent lactate racemase [Pseudomonadota bacterium]
MTTYNLKYGNERISFELPEKWHTKVLKHSEPASVPLKETLVQSLKNPINHKSFTEWLKPFREVLIIVPDITRYAGMERVLPVLYENFLQNVNVKCLFALGNHRKQTEDEKKSLVSESIYNRFPCIDHDCFDNSGLTSVGKTSTGLEVVLDSLLINAEAAIVTGSINFHYLAGFGGGRKSIFPGVAGYETILGIHRKVFNPDKPGKHIRAKSGILEGNPMHEEIMQGISLIKTPMFLINTVLDDKKNFLNIFAGDIRDAHEQGCAWFKEHFEVKVDKKADVVITSSGGFPKDINFIQSHKAIEHAMGAVKENGTLIVTGQCSDGMGNSDFLKWFDLGSTGEMEPFVRKADKVYAQTAYSTRFKAERCNIVMVSQLEGDQVKKMGLTPKQTIQEAIMSIDDGKEKLCYIIPDGSNTLIT